MDYRCRARTLIRAVGICAGVSVAFTANAADEMTQKDQKEAPQSSSVTVAPFHTDNTGGSAVGNEDRTPGDPLTSVVCDNVDVANCQERVIIDATPHGRIQLGEVNAIRQKRFDNFRPSADGYMQQVCIRVEYFNDVQCSLLYDDDMDPMTPDVAQNPNPHDANLYGLLQITFYDDFLGFPQNIISGPFRGDGTGVDEGSGLSIADPLNVTQAYTGDSIGFNTPTFFEYGMSATFDAGDEPFFLGNTCYWVEFDYEDNASTCVTQMSASYSAGPLPTANGSGGPTDGLTMQGQDIGDRFSITFDRTIRAILDPALDLRSFDLHMCLRLNSLQDGTGVNVPLTITNSENIFDPRCSAKQVVENDTVNTAKTLACSVLGSNDIQDTTWATFDTSFSSGACRASLAEAFESSAGDTWYQFNATTEDPLIPGTASAILGTCNTNQLAGEGAGDTILVIYAFNDPMNIPAVITSADVTEIGCSDNACGAGLSQICVTNLVLNNPYLVRVHARDYGDQGVQTFTLQCPCPFIENDTCDTAGEILTADFTQPGGTLVNGGTGNGNKNLGEPVGCESTLEYNNKQDEDGIDGNTAWYRLAGQGHIVQLSTENQLSMGGLDYDTALAVFCSEDDSCSGLACIGGNDDLDPANSNFKSQVEFCAIAGKTYYIAVFGFGGDSGDFALSVEELTDSINNLPIDCCANGNVCSFVSEFEIPFGSLNELTSAQANTEDCDDGSSAIPPAQPLPDISGTNNLCNGPTNMAGNYQGQGGFIFVGEPVDGAMFSLNGGRDIDNYIFEGLEGNGLNTVVDFTFQGESSVFIRTEFVFSNWFGCPGLATGLHFGGLEFEGERISWTAPFKAEFSTANNGAGGPGNWFTMNFELRQNINGQGVPCGQRDRYWLRVNESLDEDLCVAIADPAGNPTTDDPMDPEMGTVTFGDYDLETIQPTWGDERWGMFGTVGNVPADRCGTLCTDNDPMDPNTLLNDRFAGETCTGRKSPSKGGTAASLPGCGEANPLPGDFILLRDGVPMVGDISGEISFSAVGVDVDWFKIQIGTDADIIAGTQFAVHMDVQSNYAMGALLLEDRCDVTVDNQVVYGAAGVLGACTARGVSADDITVLPAGVYIIDIRWRNLFTSGGGYAILSDSNCEFNGNVNGLNKYILTVTGTALPNCSVDTMGSRVATAEAFEGCPATSNPIILNPSTGGPLFEERSTNCPSEDNDGCTVGTYEADELILSLGGSTSDAVNGLLHSQFENDTDSTQNFLIDQDYYNLEVPAGEIWALSFGGTADGPVRFQVANVGDAGSLCNAELFPGTDTRFRTNARGLLRVLATVEAGDCLGAASSSTVYLSEGFYAVIASPGSIDGGLAGASFECDLGEELTYVLNTSIEEVGSCCTLQDCVQSTAGSCAGDFTSGAVCDAGYASGAGSAYSDISGSGTNLNLVEESTAVVTLGAAFTFYGNAYTQIAVSDNGYVVMGGTADTGSSAAPRAIADAGTPNAIVAPAWHNWDPTAEGNKAGNAVYSLVSGNVTTIQWNVTRQFSYQQGANFQLVLDSSDGSIEFRYGAFFDNTLVASNAGSLGDVSASLFSSGLEDETGLRGTVHSLDLDGNTNVRFTADDSCPAPACCVGNGAKESPGQVNFGDITAVLGNFNNNYGAGNTGPGDSNCDGVVNFGDITSTLGNWLNACP